MAVTISIAEERARRRRPVAVPSQPAIVGRDAELAALQEFVAGDEPARAMLLTGEPGIGKTTLWEGGIAAARERGVRVLVARPTDAEANLSFAALLDLLEDVAGRELAGLPAPQREALDVALLRAAPHAAPPQPQAIAVGVLAALRSLSASRPVLVAIDDVPALDAPSAQAIAYAARRLTDAPVQFLLARRPGTRCALVGQFDPAAIRMLEVGPLSFGATRRLLADRLELAPPRRVLRQVFEAAGGNPLFVLELGRVLRERGTPALGEPLMVPQLVDDLLADRIEQMSEPARHVLMAVAISAGMPIDELAAVADQTALDDALDAGVVAIAADRVQVAHPLLGAVALRRLPAGSRRALHRELACVARDVERRGQHLALATAGRDAGVAAQVAAASDAAAARGAAATAVELSEHALRLTPADDPGRVERLLALGGHLDVAGEAQRVTDLLEPEIASLPPGGARVRAYVLLADGGAVASVADHKRLVALALAEAAGNPVLRARVLALKIEETLVAGLTRAHQCERWAAEALAAAPDAGPGVERIVLHAAAWCRALRGQPIDDLQERFAAASDAAEHIYRSVARVAGLRLLWRGELRAARARIEHLNALADQRGDEWSYLVTRWHRCELELRAGEWDAAERMLADWEIGEEFAWIADQIQARCRAVLAAGRGDPEQADRWTTEALQRTEESGMGWDRLEALRARGIAALLAREPERALESLRPVWEHAVREGIDEPGVFPVAPDLVAALVEVGEVDEARAVTRRLCDLAAAQDHPWGRATARRCVALVRFAARDDTDGAAEALADAAAEYERLGLRFDHARTLLSLGRYTRRLRRWGDARAAFEQAVAAFDALGSAGWAELARAELGRVGGRRPSDGGELTATEQRVAELAASGLTNKELAATLFVTVSTIETHLSHIYAKLGVRSRTQLAARLG